MRNLAILGIVFLLAACGGTGNDREKGNTSAVVSVSIAPYKYFIEAIAGDDFEVNIMVPAGASPHTYEPTMAQIQALSSSLAYISNGYLDFELAWLYRFYEVNPAMKIVSFANNQELLYSKAWQHDDHMHYEGVDPHFWISPKSAYRVASDLKGLLSELKPDLAATYEENYTRLVAVIAAVDDEVSKMLAPYSSHSFMIYHPVLGYFARDYNLKQVAVEHEGKEPSPAALKSLVDNARSLGIKTIFVQQEFDRKNAEVIAAEINASVVTIDPLSADWPSSVRGIAAALAAGFADTQQ
jgi:zinc transport system substrate-binding protein